MNILCCLNIYWLAKNDMIFLHLKLNFEVLTQNISRVLLYLLCALIFFYAIEKENSWKDRDYSFLQIHLFFFLLFFRTILILFFCVETCRNAISFRIRSCIKFISEPFKPLGKKCLNLHLWNCVLNIYIICINLFIRQSQLILMEKIWNST